ncbi:MAG: hypothetical protein ABIP48_18510 [Planctomycetota bacterium]
MLLVKATQGDLSQEDSLDLTIELYRGDRLRDRRRLRVDFSASGYWSAAFRLHWSTGPASSSRLSCHVLANGRQIARHQLLIGPPQVDGQGRFPRAMDSSVSSATMIAFEDMLSSQVRRVCEPGDGTNRANSNGTQNRPFLAR